MRAFFLALSLFAGCTHLDSELVTIDGRTVEIALAGEGPDTVVFESGLDDDWSRWDRVANDVADDARVFAYSRPGYGESDPAVTERDPAHIVEELRGLLDVADLAPPYVLVGHSNGGGYMELFAKNHPDEVAAVVLLDPRPLDFLEACEEEGVEGCGIPDDALAEQSEVVRAEYTAYAQGSDELTGDFGEYPVRVLTATRHPGTSDAWFTLWNSMHADLAASAVDGEQIVFEGAGHYLQVSHPRDVADVIRSVLPE